MAEKENTVAVQLNELKQKLATIKMDVLNGKEKNTAQIRKVRKEIARLLTANSTK